MNHCPNMWTNKYHKKGFTFNIFRFVNNIFRFVNGCEFIKVSQFYVVQKDNLAVNKVDLIYCLIFRDMSNI